MVAGPSTPRSRNDGPSKPQSLLNYRSSVAGTSELGFFRVDELKLGVRGCPDAQCLWLVRVDNQQGCGSV